jgi:hypothetical protein
MIKFKSIGKINRFFLGKQHHNRRGIILYLEYHIVSVPSSKLGPPIASPASESVPAPPPPGNQRGGGSNTRQRVRVDPNRTTGEKPGALCTLCLQATRRRKNAAVNGKKSGPSVIEHLVIRTTTFSAFFI